MHMNNFFKISFACIILITCTLSAKADYDFKVNNINYNIKSLEERTCVVCNPSGGYSVSTDPNYTGDFVIPSVVNNNGTSFTVVGIEMRAFSQSSITSITMPNSVIEIGYGAFRHCEKLRSVKFSNQLKFIGDEAFLGCKSLKTIKFPSTLCSIGKGAFYECPLQGKFVAPRSCYHIDNEAFVFSNISVVIIPNRGDMEPMWIGVNCFPSADSIYLGTDLGNYIQERGMKDFNGVYFSRTETRTSLYNIPKVTFGDSVRYMPGMEAQQYGIALKKLTIGYNIQRVPWMPNHILGKIYLRNPNPPLADGFTERTYVNAVLYVPRGSKSAYQSAHAWKKFVNIQEYDVHLPSSVQEFNKRVIVDGRECAEMNGLYWQTKNVGASSPYDIGTNFAKYGANVLLDSIKIWEARGWRLPTQNELRKCFHNWHGDPYKTSVQEHVFHSDKVNGYEFYYSADIHKPYVILPVADNLDDYCLSDVHPIYRLRLVRLVMDKSRVQKQLDEKRKKEEQQRRKEEEERLKARYSEINKLVEKKGAAYAVNGPDMQYEFALENTKPYDKSKAHTLVLRYAKNGALYMSVNNGGNNELNTLFSNMKLEGTSRHWSEGYYKIASSSSNADVAKELSRILKGMSVAQKIYLQQKKAEEDAKAKQRAQALSEQRKNRQVITRLLSHPLGIESTNWTDSYSSQKKTVFAEFPQIKKSSKSNCINGSLGIEIAIYDRYVSYVFINYMKDEIYVRYTIEAKSSQFRSDLFEDVSDSFLSLPYALKHEDRRVERDKKGIKCKRLIGTPSKQRVLTVEFIVD